MLLSRPDRSAGWLSRLKRPLCTTRLGLELLTKSLAARPSRARQRPVLSLPRSGTLRSIPDTTCAAHPPACCCHCRHHHSAGVSPSRLPFADIHLSGSGFGSVPARVILLNSPPTAQRLVRPSHSPAQLRLYCNCCAELRLHLRSLAPPPDRLDSLRPRPIPAASPFLAWSDPLLRDRRTQVNDAFVLFAPSCLSLQVRLFSFISKCLPIPLLGVHSASSRACSHPPCSAVLLLGGPRGECAVVHSSSRAALFGCMFFPALFCPCGYGQAPGSNKSLTGWRSIGYLPRHHSWYGTINTNKKTTH